MGNSYANQLYPGFSKNPSLSHHVVLSIGTCEIVRNEVQILDPNSPCFGTRQDHQQNLIDDIIENTPELKFIVINGLGSTTPDYLNRLKNRIDKFEQLGKKVIIFTPHITPSFDPKVCFTTPFRQVAKDCSFPKSKRKSTLDNFQPLVNFISSSNPNVMFFEQNEIYCRDEKCSYLLNGMPLHRDSGHMSEYGSIQLQDFFTEWASKTIPEIFKPETSKSLN